MRLPTYAENNYAYPIRRLPDDALYVTPWLAVGEGAHRRWGAWFRWPGTEDWCEIAWSHSKPKDPAKWARQRLAACIATQERRLAASQLAVVAATDTLAALRAAVGP